MHTLKKYLADSVSTSSLRLPRPSRSFRGASQRLDASCTLSTFRASPRATDRTPPLSRAAGQHGARHEACSSAVAVKKGEVSHANPSARSGLVAGVWGGTRGTEREAGRKDSE